MRGMGLDVGERDVAMMLEGRRILVTQAGEFMGPTLCEVLAEHGAEVVPSGASLIEAGAVAAMVREAGRIDVLVANLALPAPSTSAIDVDETEWRQVFAALVDPLPHLARAVLPQMIERRAGMRSLPRSCAAPRRTASWGRCFPSAVDGWGGSMLLGLRTAIYPVTDLDAALQRLLELGAALLEPVQDVGGGIRVGAVKDPFGNRLGFIENPQFDLRKVR